MCTKTLRLAGAATLAVVLTACGSSGGRTPPASDDTTTFCAHLGAQMMVMADMSEGNTPEPGSFAKSVEAFRDAADKIATQDPDWSELGDATTLFFNHPDENVRADSYSQMRRYCNEHGLSPFPQDGSRP